MDTSGETIAAIATAPGRGGVAVIRVSGPAARTIAERLTGAPLGAASVALRAIHQPDDTKVLLDRGLLVQFHAPHSYTGEDVVEFQVHGGRVTPRRILEACCAAGARLARRGEFTERAFLNGRLTYEQAEGVLDLVNAKTDRAADAALAGLEGRRQRELRKLYATALAISSELEHALDVSEDELPAEFLPAIRARLTALVAALGAAVRDAREGRLLREGALVVLAGPPNAGKSSLMNALLGESRVIVSATPGTTRDSVEEGLALAGWPIRLVDTAGLRETGDAIEGAGVVRARELIEQAEVVIELTPAAAEPVKSETASASRIAVTSKCDLQRGPGLNVSTKTGEGLEELKRAIVMALETRAAAIDEAAGGDEMTAAMVRVRAALAAAAELTDPVLLANAVRSAADELGRLVGATYSEDLLAALFSRFCVGK